MHGDGTVYRRNKVFWIRYRHNGKEVRESTGFTERSNANKYLKDKIRERAQPDFAPPDIRKVTVAMLVEWLLERYAGLGYARRVRDCKAHWHHLKPAFGDTKAAALSSTMFDAYRKQRRDEGASQTTINRELQTLRRALHSGAQHTPPLVLRIPRFDLPHEDNARQRFFDRDEVARLKVAAGQHSLWARVFVDIASTYGWRKGELLSLRVADVLLADNAIRLRTSKNGEPREVPILADLRVLLAALVAGKAPTDWLFPVRDPRDMWDAVRKAAGVENANLHDWRRTSARNKRAAGVDTSLIMKMQGWNTESMFRRYAITDTLSLAAALEKEQQANVDKMCTNGPGAARREGEQDA